MIDLHDHNVVVVGGSSGIGRAAVETCLKLGARVTSVGLAETLAEGANVTATPPSDAATNSQPLTEDQNARLTECFGDARDSAFVQQVVADAAQSRGGLHGLLHVAGGSGRRWGDGPLHEMSDEAWLQTIELNLHAVAWSNRAAIRQFLAQDSGGSIVNIGSVMAESPSRHGFATHAYITAKAGIAGLSRALATEYATHNIRVNVVQPGLVATPMSRRAQQDASILHYVKTKQPLDGGRLGTVDDLTATLALLLSPAAKFMTGQVVSIDGGWQASEGQVH